MKLDLHEVAAHLGKRITYELDEPPIDDPKSGLQGVEPVTGEATFTNAGRNIVVRGKFRTAVSLECSRCLQSYRLDIEAPIEEGLPLTDRGPEMAPDTEPEELPEDEEEPLFEENIFDLGEYLRQAILVALPIRPVCSDDCKGLCPHCGANLNEHECECPTETANSPFSALGELLELKVDDEN